MAGGVVTGEVGYRREGQDVVQAQGLCYISFESEILPLPQLYLPSLQKFSRQHQDRQIRTRTGVSPRRNSSCEIIKMLKDAVGNNPAVPSSETFISVPDTQSGADISTDNVIAIALVVLPYTARSDIPSNK